MATERFQIVISERGSRVVRRNISGVGARARQSGTAVNFLRTALLGLASGVVIRQLVQLSDSFTLIQNRLGLVTSSQQQLIQVNEELLAVSNRSRSSFEANAELFTRIALSTRQLGVTQREVLQITESLNQAIVLSGATAQEARNGIIQFAQGLASGTLRGDELRAVLEQLPLVADVIADELGVTRGALRELAAEGRITGEVIVNAFRNAREELAEKFAQTVPTIAQAFTILQNNIIFFVGSINEATGVSRLFVDAIISVSKNIDFLGRVVIAGVFVGSLFLATTAVTALTAAIAANPVGALAVLLTSAVVALIAFSDKVVVLNDGLTTLADLIVALGQEFGGAFVSFAQAVIEQISSIGSGFEDLTGDAQVSFEDVLIFSARFADRFVGVFVGVGQVLQTVFTNLPEVVRSAFVGVFNGVIAGGELIIDFFTALLRTLGRQFDVFGRRVNIAFINIGAALEQAIAGNFAVAGTFLEEATFQLQKGAEGIATGFGDTFSQEFEKSRESIDTLRLDTSEAEQLGADIASAFREGFEQTTGIEDLINRALMRARAASEARAAERALQEAQADLLGQRPPGGPGSQLTERDIALQKVNDRLRLRLDTLRNINGQQQVQNALLQIENRLRTQGITLSEAERRSLEVQLEFVEVAERQRDLFQEIRGEQTDLALSAEALNNLFTTGAISVEDFTFKLRELQASALDSSRNVADGFERGFLRLQNQIGDFASQAESTLVNAFNSAEDALVDFVLTGQVNFSQLVDSILADLTRLVARQALFGLLGAATGGSQGFAGTAGQFFFGGERQAGGPVSPGRSFLVGERGPELFVPPSAGNIVPNGQLSGAPPQVNVTVVNVTDPEEVTSALASPEGENAVLNVIRRNPRTVQQLVSR